MHCARGGEKLRRQRLAVSHLTVFISTSRFRQNPEEIYLASTSWQLPFPTSYTPGLIAAAHSLLERVYQPGFVDHKAGVFITDIVADTERQQSILMGIDNERRVQLMQNAADDELIFDPKRTGRKRRQLMACFQAAVKGASLSDFHFHDLRHTFATRLRAANVHPYDIADLLGHSVPEGETRATRITRGYAHGVPQRLRDAVNSLEQGKQVILAGLPSVCQQAV